MKEKLGKVVKTRQNSEEKIGKTAWKLNKINTLLRPESLKDLIVDCFFYKEHKRNQKIFFGCFSFCSFWKLRQEIIFD